MKTHIKKQWPPIEKDCSDVASENPENVEMWWVDMLVIASDFFCSTAIVWAEFQLLVILGSGRASFDRDPPREDHHGGRRRSFQMLRDISTKPGCLWESVGKWKSWKSWQIKHLRSKENAKGKEPSEMKLPVSEKPMAHRASELWLGGHGNGASEPRQCCFLQEPGLVASLGGRVGHAVDKALPDGGLWPGSFDEGQILWLHWLVDWLDWLIGWLIDDYPLVNKHSYWKWPFIVYLPIKNIKKNVIFHIVMLVYQTEGIIIHDGSW